MTRDRWLVVVMAAVFAVTGFIEPHLPIIGNAREAVTVAQLFAMALLLFAWCKAHAHTHSIQIPTGAPVLVALFAVVGVPYYAFRGYSLGRALLLVILAIATLLGLAAIHAVCFVVSSRLAP